MSDTALLVVVALGAAGVGVLVGAGVVAWYGLSKIAKIVRGQNR